MHGPSPASESGCHRSCADCVVLGEEHGTSDNCKDELKEAGDKSAVDRADSAPVSPGSDEHEERVETDNSESGGHENGDGSQLRARFLAVHITIFRDIGHGFKQIGRELLVVPVQAAFYFNFDIPSISTESIIRGRRNLFIFFEI